MCGIAGWLGHVDVGQDDIDGVLDSLRHRGPDGRAAKTFDNAGLLHTRLRIIDLSPLGDQPMANEDGTVWVVFNGEIYNHHELRRDLERAGHRFRGASDTEVLPHLYEEHGEDMLPMLRGMFSLAVLDRRANSLLLGRDRFGIKPLFFSHDGARLAFASEIRALRRFPKIGQKHDRQAIADYSALLFVPAPRTLYTDIECLEPGCAVHARVTANGMSFEHRRYHRWAPDPNWGLTLDEAVEIATPAVDQGVHRQLESDVPLGAMLSGGIDSSLVAAAAQRELGGELHTFNVRQAEAEYDETALALAVARAIGSHHTTLEMSDARGSWQSITELLGALGQPFADTSIFAVRLLSTAMRGHVTVALSGDGGDEAFGGYDVYWQLAPVARVARLPASLARLCAQAARPAAAAGLVRRTLPRRLADLSGADDASIMQTMFCWLRAAEQAGPARGRRRSRAR